MFTWSLLAAALLWEVKPLQSMSQSFQASLFVCGVALSQFVCSTNLASLPQVTALLLARSNSMWELTNNAKEARAMFLVSVSQRFSCPFLLLTVCSLSFFFAFSLFCSVGERQACLRHLLSKRLVSKCQAFPGGRCAPLHH